MRTLLAILAIFFIAPVTAQTTLYCVPNEPRLTAPDRLVSVEIKLLPNGEFNSVLYRAANGAAYDRGDQYSAKNTFYNGRRLWIGTLKINHNVGMMGSLYHDSGRLIYVETVHDNKQGGKVVSQVVSVCDEPPFRNAEAPPLPGQADALRAAQARAETDRLIAERKEQEARTEKVSILEKSRDLIREKMLGCIGREGASMVLTDEKAEVVAKASMIFCQADVDAWIRSSIEIASTQGGQPADQQTLHEAMEKTALDVITAYVVKARGEIIRKNLDNPAPPIARPPADPKQSPPA
jgi:hypothetical protein